MWMHLILVGELQEGSCVHVTTSAIALSSPSKSGREKLWIGLNEEFIINTDNLVAGEPILLRATMALPRAAASPTPTSISLANKIVIFGLMLWVNVMWAPRNPKRAACRAGRAAVMNVMQNSEALIEGGFQQNIQLMLSASQTVWKRRCFLPRIRVTVQQTDENEPFYGRLIESRCAGFLLKFSWWGETGCPEGPVQRMNKLPLLCCLTSSLGMKRLKINSWEIPGGICGLGVSRFLCPLQDPGKCCFVGTGGWGEGNNFSHLFFFEVKN